MPFIVECFCIVLSVSIHAAAHQSNPGTPGIFMIIEVISLFPLLNRKKKTRRSGLSLEIMDYHSN